MGKQLIIAVSREFGSGGHEIADILAKKFNIPIYDNNLLTEIANSKNLDVDTLEKYDEKPQRILMGYKAYYELMRNSQFSTEVTDSALDPNKRKFKKIEDFRLIKENAIH